MRFHYTLSLLTLAGNNENLKKTKLFEIQTQQRAQNLLSCPVNNIKKKDRSLLQYAFLNQSWKWKSENFKISQEQPIKQDLLEIL